MQKISKKTLKEEVPEGGIFTNPNSIHKYAPWLVSLVAILWGVYSNFEVLYSSIYFNLAFLIIFIAILYYSYSNLREIKSENNLKKESLELEKKRYEQSERFIIHEDSTSVINIIKEYCISRDYTTVEYLGTLYNEIIQKILHYEEEGHFSKTKIFSSCPESILNLGRDTYDKLLKKEISTSKGVFSTGIYLDKQICTIVKFKSNDNLISTFLIFEKPITTEETLQYYALEIRDQRLQIDFSEISFDEEKKPVFQHNMKEISNNFSSMVKTWKQLWVPCKQGYFKDVLPPISDNTVREKWRISILRNHNNFIKDVVEHTKFKKLSITWNLTCKSFDDMTYFSEFLETLKRLSDPKIYENNISIDRYQFIDGNKYKTNEDEYQDRVDLIIEELDKGRNKRFYKLFFIDKRTVTHLDSLVGDYALISNSDEGLRMIQSSIEDGKDDESLEEVLKIYFSKDKKIVDEIEERFNVLESSSYKFEDFNKFVNHIKI